MRTSVLRWLLQRGKPNDRFVSPSMRAYLAIERHRAGIDEDMQRHPEMCAPLMTKPTQHVTRVIDQGATVPGMRWDDERRTFTMETQRVRV